MKNEKRKYKKGNEELREDKVNQDDKDKKQKWKNVMGRKPQKRKKVWWGTQAVKKRRAKVSNLDHGIWEQSKMEEKGEEEDEA